MSAVRSHPTAVVGTTEPLASSGPNPSSQGERGRLHLVPVSRRSASLVWYNGGMNEDQFLKLFKYIEETRTEVREIRETMATKDDIRRLESVIDSYAGKIDDYAKEMAAMQHKIDRLERMIYYLADKANISRDQLELAP